MAILDGEDSRTPKSRWSRPAAQPGTTGTLLQSLPALITQFTIIDGDDEATKPAEPNGSNPVKRAIRVGRFLGMGIVFVRTITSPGSTAEAASRRLRQAQQAVSRWGWQAFGLALSSP